MKRVRLWADALWALKKTKRSTPASRAACTMRQVATALSSSIDPPGWSRMAAARCTTVSTPRSALRNDGGSDEVAEGDLHAHALGAQAPRVAHQAAHRPPRRRSGAAAARSRRARWRR